MTPPVPDAPPPLLIANPMAGRGRARRLLPAAVAKLREGLGGVDVVLTRSAGHAQHLAARAVIDRRPLVLCLGGDGTLDEVVNGLVGSGSAAAQSLPRVGVLAAGLGGDFGKTLALGRDLETQIETITRGDVRVLDVGWARFDEGGRQVERLWINVLSAGIGGLVDRYSAQAPVVLPGFVSYAQATLRAIVVARRVPLRCRALLADGRLVARPLHAYAVAVCNGTTFGAGMKIAPDARPDDGLLDVVVIETPSKLRLVRRLHTLYQGRHLLERGVVHFRCREVALEPAEPHPCRPDDPGGAAGRARHTSSGLFPLDIDGDARGDIPLEAAVLPAALRVCVPRRVTS